MAGLTPRLRKTGNLMWPCCVSMFSCVDAGGVSSIATVAITLKETNDFPPQLFPLSGSVCRDAARKSSGLVMTAVDEDLPPHAAPFTFEILDELSVNWTVIQVNGKERALGGCEGGATHSGVCVNLLTTRMFLPSSDTHAVLQPLVELEAGEYAVMLLVSDSGSPVLSVFTQVNVTVCLCDSFGDCKSEAGAVLGSSVGISFIALIIIMASIALLLCKCHL